MENNTYGQPGAPGDPNDFFGGTVLPHAQHTKEYADFRVPTSTAPATKSGSVPIVLAAVGVLAVAILGYVGYRVFFVPTIEMPEEMLGMQRANLDTSMTDTVDEFDQLPGLGGKQVEIHAGMYTAGSQVLFVMAGEAGTTDPGEVEQYFAGMDQAMKTQMAGVSLAPAAAGDEGGSVRCFETAQSGVTMGGCAWLAEDTFGMVIESPATADMAQRTQDVRSEIEN